jgi:hypothetical protein
LTRCCTAVRISAVGVRSFSASSSSNARLAVVSKLQFSVGLRLYEASVAAAAAAAAVYDTIE